MQRQANSSLRVGSTMYLRQAQARDGVSGVGMLSTMESKNKVESARARWRSNGLKDTGSLV